MELNYCKVSITIAGAVLKNKKKKTKWSLKCSLLLIQQSIKLFSICKVS